MPEPLKDIYNNFFFERYIASLREVLPHYSIEELWHHFTSDEWESLFLKERMAYLSQRTAALLNVGFYDKYLTIMSLIDILRKQNVKDQNLTFMFLPDIITLHSPSNPSEALKALKDITTFVSCEFSVRPIIDQNQDLALQYFKEWTKDANPNVRRWLSEGCRPRLPWGMQLKTLVLDPSPIIPILQDLKSDASSYVLTSVSNNLNDISKDHPDTVLDILNRWKQNNSVQRKTLKHAARTLLKQGNKVALNIFDTAHDAPYILDAATGPSQSIHIGDTVNIRATLTNTGNKMARYRIEYVVFYLKKSGQYNKKVFMITEKTLNPGDSYTILKEHKFRDLSIRKHHMGEHFIALSINGNLQDKKSIIINDL